MIGTCVAPSLIAPCSVFDATLFVLLKSICVHLVLSFCTVSWSYFDEFCIILFAASNYRLKIL